MKCDRSIERTNCGLPYWDDCENEAKYKVTYREGTRGNTVSENVCGLHKNSIKKLCDRALKKYNFNTNYEEVAI